LDSYALREGGSVDDYRQRISSYSPGEFAAERTPSYLWLFLVEAVLVVAIVIGFGFVVRRSSGDEDDQASSG